MLSKILTIAVIGIVLFVGYATINGDLYNRTSQHQATISQEVSTPVDTSNVDTSLNDDNVDDIPSAPSRVAEPVRGNRITVFRCECQDQQ